MGFIRTPEFMNEPDNQELYIENGEHFIEDVYQNDFNYGKGDVDFHGWEDKADDIVSAAKMEKIRPMVVNAIREGANTESEMNGMVDGYLDCLKGTLEDAGYLEG